METINNSTAKVSVCTQCGNVGYLRNVFDEQVCESCEKDIGKGMDASEIMQIVARQGEEFVLKVVEEIRKSNEPF